MPTRPHNDPTTQVWYVRLPGPTTTPLLSSVMCASSSPPCSCRVWSCGARSLYPRQLQQQGGQGVYACMGGGGGTGSKQVYIPEPFLLGCLLGPFVPILQP